MLSEKELNRQSGLPRRISKFDRPELAEPVTVRVIFTKTGNLQFFSHLDLQRTWQRVLVRASIPMWYTKGFNPHSKIVFGIPLPVGSESCCEMVDLRIDRAIGCEEIRDQLNAELTDEMQVLDVYFPKTKYTDVAYAEYNITVHTKNASHELAARINEIFAKGSEPIVMSKRSKSGDKDINILDLTRSVEAEYDPTTACLNIKAVLAAGSSENLNPEYLITAIKQKFGVLPEEGVPNEEWYRILRVGYMTASGETFR